MRRRRPWWRWVVVRSVWEYSDVPDREVVWGYLTLRDARWEARMAQLTAPMGDGPRQTFTVERASRKRLTAVRKRA